MSRPRVRSFRFRVFPAQALHLSIVSLGFGVLARRVFSGCVAFGPYPQIQADVHGWLGFRMGHLWSGNLGRGAHPTDLLRPAGVKRCRNLSLCPRTAWFPVAPFVVGKLGLVHPSERPLATCGRQEVKSKLIAADGLVPRWPIRGRETWVGAPILATACDLRASRGEIQADVHGRLGSQLANLWLGSLGWCAHPRDLLRPAGIKRRNSTDVRRGLGSQMARFCGREAWVGAPIEVTSLVDSDLRRKME